MARRMAPSEEAEESEGSVTVATGWPSMMMVTDPWGDLFPDRLPWCASFVLTTRDVLLRFTGAMMREVAEDGNIRRRRTRKIGN